MMTKAHAEAGQREHRVVTQDAQHVIGAEEVVVAQCAEKDEQGIERDQRPLTASSGESGSSRSTGSDGPWRRRSCRFTPLLRPHRAGDNGALTTSAAASGTPLASNV